VKQNITVKGFEGTYPYNLTAYKALEKKDISWIVQKLLLTIDTSCRSGIEEYVKMCKIISNEESIEKMIIRSLVNKKSSEIDSFVKNFEGFKKERFYRNIPKYIESAFIIMLDQNIPRIDVVKIFSEVTEIKPASTILVKRLFVEQKNDLHFADMCMRAGMDEETILKESDLSRLVASNILTFTKNDCKSKLFEDADLAGYNLNLLKEGFKIKSFSEYSINLDAIERLEEKKAQYNTFNSAMSRLYPKLSSAQREVEEIKKYDTLFSDLIGTSSEDKLVSIDSVLSIKSARSMGVNLRIHLAEALLTIVEKNDLDLMIKNAFEAGAISKNQRSSYEEIRKFSNVAAHETTVPRPDKKDVENWIWSIKELHVEKEGSK